MLQKVSHSLFTLRFVLNNCRMKFIAFLSILLTVSQVVGQELPLETVDQTKLIKDLVKSEAVNNKTYMSLWLPEVYWEFMVGQGVLTELQYEEFISMTKGYSIFFVFAGSLNDENTLWDADSETKLLKQIQITYNGKVYTPLKDKQLTVELRDFSETMQPMMTQMFGSMGNGFRYFFFDIRDSNQECIVDPLKDSDLKIKIDNDVTFTYNLPFPSLFEDKKCPVDSEEFPYNYNYCPIHGNELK